MQTKRLCQFAAAALAAVGLAAGAQVAAAQKYPSKNVTVIVPYTAGGSADLMSRTMAQHLSKAWGVNFVIDNRAGASGMIGAEIVSKAPGDGYTMLGTTSSYTATAAIRKKLPFDPAKAFMPVGTIARAPMLIAVHPSVPAKNVKELVALAKQFPGKFNYGSSGTGGNNHFSGALFGAAADLKMVHVPYKGIANATTALASGEVELVISSSASLLPLINANKVRILAVTSEGRSPMFPDLPVAGDIVKGYSYYLWWAIFVPASTPADTVAFINAAFNKVLASAEMKKFLDTQGAEPWPHSVADLKKLLPDEIARYKKAMEIAGIQPQ